MFFYLMNIQISNLKKTFGEKTAVDIASFTIHQGDMLGLVGNNGAGKTTLFRLILDLIKADEGEVTLTGEQFPSTPPRASNGRTSREPT